MDQAAIDGSPRTPVMVPILDRDTNLDQKVYNASTVDQVVVIWIEDNNPNVASDTEK